MVLIALLFVHIIVTIASARNDDLDWFDPLIDVRSMVLDDFVEEADAEAPSASSLRSMTSFFTAGAGADADAAADDV